MKQLLIFLLLFSLTFNITAQQYQTVYSNNISCFVKENNLTDFVKVDSFTYQTDSIFYFPQNRSQLGELCFNYGDSWIGGKAIIKSNGDNLFFSKYSDTIIIKTQARLNDTWICMRRGDSLNIVASIVKHDTLTFVGITDSVKTIAFSVYDKSMNPITSNVNNLTIEISKYFGLIKTFNFKLFPDYTEFYGSEFLKELTLVGLSENKKGIQNFTWNDVYDFKPGDELHISEYYTPGMTGNGYPSYTSEIQKFISRSVNSDTIKFSLDRIQSKRIEKPNETRYTYLHDTVDLNIGPNPNFDKLPGEPIVEYDLLLTYNLRINEFPEKYLSMQYSFIKGKDTCWNPIQSEGCSSTGMFIKGLGGPYFHENCQLTFETSERKPVYYKKGTEVWGTPMVITENRAIYYNEIRVTPNPVVDFINIDVPSEFLPCEFHLTNLNGQQILTKIINQKITVIPVPDQKAGIYLYSVTDKNRVVFKSGKIVVE